MTQRETTPLRHPIREVVTFNYRTEFERIFHTTYFFVTHFFVQKGADPFCTNQEQLALYYGIGRYISYNTRKGAWGKDAIATISKQLSIEMPGLKGFYPSNLKKR